MHPGQRNSLDALCKRYEVDASKRDVHGALIDSELLARVYLAMTGGQTALLLDEEEDSRRSGRETATGNRGLTTALAGATADDLKLTVIKASKEEFEAHEALLEKIRQSGVCVWDDVV
jgi:DNA polymerase-3 subunit epsilon